MSYLTRPPRLPLPIEEELHKPGSPIIAPMDAGAGLADIQELDSGHTSHPDSIPSTDGPEDVTDELRVDRSKDTVPTRLEWLRGGDKVYVTGTIFEWNKKTRLNPEWVSATPFSFLPL